MSHVWSVEQALERVAGLLEGSGGSVTIAERGDMVGVPRHPNFRLLAAMNPATDAGKRDLPAPLRNRFTEVRFQSAVLAYFTPDPKCSVGHAAALMPSV